MGPKSAAFRPGPVPPRTNTTAALGSVDESEPRGKHRRRHRWTTTTTDTSSALQIYSLQSRTIEIVITTLQSAGIIRQGCSRPVPGKIKYPTPPSPKTAVFLIAPFWQPYVNKHVRKNSPRAKHKKRPLKQGRLGQKTPLKGPKLPQNDRFFD